ncbi:MAG: cupin [Gemmatimonadaceae bacterium]|nr:cupin [Gemmatimonadaceae bacterium]
MSGRVEITTVPKPWGHEIIWARTDRYVGKILHIKAGHALSVQYHNVKDETVFLLSGEMKYWVAVERQAPGARRTDPPSHESRVTSHTPRTAGTGEVPAATREPIPDLIDVHLRVGDAFRITPHTIHYMEAVTDCDVLEVSTPELDDVVRIKDRYGREGTSAP